MIWNIMGVIGWLTCGFITWSCIKAYRRIDQPKPIDSRDLVIRKARARFNQIAAHTDIKAAQKIAEKALKEVKL